MMSVGVNYKTSGKKLAEFANAITTRGGKIDQIKPVILNAPLVTINQEIVRQFSLTIDKKILDEANKVY